MIGAKEISTCDPEYIKQQQKLFIKFLKLAFCIKRKHGLIGIL